MPISRDRRSCDAWPAPDLSPSATSVAAMSAQASARLPAQPEVGSRGARRSSTPRPASSPGSGYHATGIMELCAANDLGKGALYHYIGSKEELLAAIHDRVMDEVMLGADRVAEAGGTPSRAAGHARRRAARRHPPLPRSRLGVPARVPRAHRRAGRAVPPAVAGTTSAASRRCCRPASSPGEFRDLDPWLTARAWLGMHNYTYLWLKPGGRLSARVVAKPFAEIFMRGIANRGQADAGAAVTAPSSRRRRPAPSRSSSGTRRRPGRSRRRPGRRPSRARADGGPRWRRAPRRAGRRGWPSGTCPGTRS